MSRKRNIFLGWTLTLGSLAVTSYAFPLMAEKAVDQRTSVQWQAQAMRYVQTDMAGMDTLYGPYIKAGDANESVSTDIYGARNQAQQLHCMAEAVYYEARSEARSGQNAVAEVVLNRVKSKHWPNSICGVVYEGSHRHTGCQFSFTCDGSLDKAPKGKAWERSQNVARTALIGGLKPITERSTHYHTVDVNPHWSNTLHFNKQIGTHRFYRFKSRRRTQPAPALAVAPPT